MEVVDKRARSLGSEECFSPGWKDAADEVTDPAGELEGESEG